MLKLENCIGIFLRLCPFFSLFCCFSQQREKLMNTDYHTIYMAEITAALIAENTYAIRGEGCDAYLLTGDTEGIMIDAGVSSRDIREFAEQVCGKKVRCVVNTHSHFDHTAGNGYFDVIYGTDGISRSAKNTFGGDPSRYKLDYEFTIINDGDIIDVGGRPLQVILLDSHSPGSIALLDINGRALFPGDEIDTGQVLLLPGYAEKPGQMHARPAASVETYLRAMTRLGDMREKYDNIYPAHNGAPVDIAVLDNFIELAKRILDGYEGNLDCSGRGYNDSMGHFPRKEANYRRGEFNGVSLIYCADLIRDADYEKGQTEPATELHRVSSRGPEK